MAFRPPCLRALYKKTKHFIQERTQRKQTSKQINKQKKREVKMKTAKNTPTQHCPEKPTVSQTSPPSRLLSCSPSSLHTLFLAPPSHHPSLSPLTNTRTTACTHAISRTNHSHTNLCCGYFSHGAAGRGPGGARQAPFTVPSPAFPPASPAPTPHSARITPPNTHRHRERTG